MTIPSRSIDTSVTKENREERARHYFEFATQPASEGVLRKDRQDAWAQVWLIKKQAKYGFERLGFTPAEIERIKLNKPDWI